MAYNKIGFHCGVNGNAQGIGEYMARLDAAAIPFVLKSVEDYGVIHESMQYTNAAHVRVFRLSNRKDGGPQFDTPNYDVMPEAAARAHWQMTLDYLPPEFDRSVWLEVINEPDKNRADWLGWFGVEIARLAAIDGYKVVLFGFSGGEPEPEHWETAGMLAYLSECAKRPHDMAVALHEYSLAVEDIWALDADAAGPLPGWLVGRFQHLHAMCAKYSLPYPIILITEWGWEYKNVPGPETAVSHIADIAELYAAYPNILGAGLWYLGGDFGDIHNQAQKLILPVTEYSLVARFPDPPPIDPPTGGGGEPVTVWKNAIRHHVHYLNISQVRIACFEEIEVTGQDGKKYLTSKFLGFPTINDDGTAELLPGTNIISLVEYSPGDDTENPNPPPVETPLPQGALVVDLSYANDVNLATLKNNGVQGVILRTSNGIRTTGSSNSDGIDVRFFEHLTEAHSLGLPWGAYHYCNENYGDAEQVSHFCNIIRKAVDMGFPPPSLGMWLDFETPDNPIYAGAPTSEGRIRALCELLAAQRPFPVVCGVYSSKGWWNPKVPTVNTWLPADFKQWIAAWVPESDLVNGLPPNDWTPANLAGFSADDLVRWQFTPAGGFTVGHTVKSLDLNYEGLPEYVNPPTPPTDTIDILEYMIGTDRQQHTLQYTWAGGGTETVQTRINGKEWKIVKGNGGNYEQLYYDDVWVYRAEDTSESAERFYTQSTNGTLGAAWVKRHMELGETVYTSKTVQHYLKAGCVPQNGGLVTDKLTLTDIYESLRFDSGIVLDDVIRLEWAAGEGYLFAKGYGLVGFEFSGGKSYISELALSGRDDLPIMVPSCLDLTGRYYV